MVAAVVWDLVRGDVLAVGGALVVPSVAPHVGQAAHGHKGEGAAIADLCGSLLRGALHFEKELMIP